MASSRGPPVPAAGTSCTASPALSVNCHITSVVHACLRELAAAVLECNCVQQRSRRRTRVVSIQRAMCGEKRPGPSRWPRIPGAGAAPDVVR